MKRYEEIKTFKLKENQRIIIDFDVTLDDYVDVFIYTKTPRIATKLVVYEKEYDDGTILHEAELLTSMDGINYYYNCFIDRVKIIYIQDYGCEKKEVWRHE